jgi:uncharacterized membrane protein
MYLKRGYDISFACAMQYLKIMCIWIFETPNIPNLNKDSFNNVILAHVGTFILYMQGSSAHGKLWK